MRALGWTAAALLTLTVWIPGATALMPLSSHGEVFLGLSLAGAIVIAFFLVTVAAIIVDWFRPRAQPVTAEPAPFQPEPASWGDVDPVIDVEGIGTTYAHLLHSRGIRTTQDLWEADADAVASDVGVSVKVVRTWQSMADLMRVNGIGKQYAEILVRAGYKSLHRLANATPAQVSKKATSYMESVDVDPTQANITPARARQLIDLANTHLSR